MSSAEETGRPKAAWGEDKKLNASQQAARRSAQLSAHGRAILALAALVGQQGGSTGADVLRRLIGREDTLTVLDSVGTGARELAQTWQADQPSSPGPAQRQSSFWDQHPDHDPRFLSGKLSLAEVRAEYEQRAAERKRAADDYYGRGQRVAIGVSQGPAGGPVQRSIEHSSVPATGTET